MSNVVEPDNSLAPEKQTSRCDYYKDLSRVAPDQLASHFGYQRVDQTDPNRLTSKLSAMLSDPDSIDIITWLPHGRSFMILDRRRFASEVLPKYYDHSNVESFLRLVNAWGFRRIADGLDRGSYYHELFLRGMPQLHARMKRSKATARMTQNIGETYPNFYDMPPLPEQDEPPRGSNGGGEDGKESNSEQSGAWAPTCVKNAAHNLDKKIEAAKDPYRIHSKPRAKELVSGDRQNNSLALHPNDNSTSHNSQGEATLANESNIGGGVMKSSSVAGIGARATTDATERSSQNPITAQGQINVYLVNMPSNGSSDFVLPRNTNTFQFTTGTSQLPFGQPCNLTTPQIGNVHTSNFNFNALALPPSFLSNSLAYQQQTASNNVVQPPILRVANPPLLSNPSSFTNPPSFTMPLFIPPIQSMLTQQSQRPYFPPPPTVASVVDSLSQLLQTSTHTTHTASPNQNAQNAQNAQTNQTSHATHATHATSGGTQLIDHIITQLLPFPSGVLIRTDDRGHIQMDAMDAAMRLLRKAAEDRDNRDNRDNRDKRSG